MELLQLKYFCDAAQTENFSKTAKKFLVPASNISQSIKRLEQELNNPLFTRSANKIELNDAGAAFYKQVKTALDMLDDAKQTIHGIKASKKININTHVNRRITMNAVKKFQKLYPDVSFVTTNTVTYNITDYDMVITEKDHDSSYIKSTASNEDLLLAYSKAHYKFNKEITADDLKDCPFVTMQSGNSMYDYIHEICNNLGFTPHIALQSDDPFYVRQCIELGLGISVVPELSWRGEFSDQVELRKIGDYKRITYVYQKRSSNPYLQKFHDMLLAEFNA